MKQHTGIVLGGPWDGRVLSWNSPHYRVAVGNMPMQAVFERNKVDAEAKLEIETFEYQHYTYIGHRFWLPAAVVRGEMFDYHHYAHPMDFVIKKLIAGYNPGAK